VVVIFACILFSDRLYARRVLAAVALLLVVTLAGCGGEEGAPGPEDMPATAKDVPPALAEACGDAYDLTARSFWQETGDGVRLYMIEAGNGTTTAVLGHGGRSDLCDTLPFATRLVAAGYRIVAFDFRGNGRSESPSRNSLALGKDLAAAVAHARAEPTASS
jgi:predicted small lipoprotein YifL